MPGGRRCHRPGQTSIGKAAIGGTSDRILYRRETQTDRSGRRSAADPGGNCRCRWWRWRCVEQRRGDRLWRRSGRTALARGGHPRPGGRGHSPARWNRPRGAGRDHAGQEEDRRPRRDAAQRMYGSACDLRFVTNGRLVSPVDRSVVSCSSMLCASRSRPDWRYRAPSLARFAIHSGPRN
jgi:hypothetical protein